MSAPLVNSDRVRELLRQAGKARVLVVGDVMLDHFVWGAVTRISPEAPVPVLNFERESYMPGGAANVARNLVSLKVPTDLFGVIGQDAQGNQLRRLLREHHIGCTGLMACATRQTSIKTRVVAHKQQIVRIDRETREPLRGPQTARLLHSLRSAIGSCAAVIMGDYGKGVITQELLNEVRSLCRSHGVWLSFDPKPVHPLDLAGLSLITPNRKEAFELARLPDETRNDDPLQDTNLMAVAQKLLRDVRPAVLLITLGEQGMLLCQRDQQPLHIPTRAREIFDVSGAGDTVIASFTLAIAAGASPTEAAVISNHAAGVVVGKIGTATVQPDELLSSFNSRHRSASRTSI